MYSSDVSSSFITLRSVSVSARPSRQFSSVCSELRRSLRVELSCLSSACNINMSANSL